MKIAMVFPEMSPLTPHNKISDACKNHLFNHSPDIEIVAILPFFVNLNVENFNISLYMQLEEHTVLRARAEGDTYSVFLIKPMDNYYPFFGLDFFNYEHIINFSLGTLNFLQKLDNLAVVHMHGWQTGLLPLLIKDKLPGIKTLFSPHSLVLQGELEKAELSVIKLSELYKNMVSKISSPSFLKLGIIYADFINVNSRTYAREILNPEFGNELEPIFKIKEDKLIGINNGVNYGTWNPEKDVKLIQNYSVKELNGKKACKADLQRKFDLPSNDDIPLLFYGTELTFSKGCDLVISCLPQLAELPIQLIIYGTGDDEYILELEDKIGTYPNVKIVLDFEKRHISNLLAGSDFILLPYRLSEGSVSHLYALKYGLIPIAHKTGAIADAVFDQTSQDNTKINGFLFNSYYDESLLDAVHEALDVFKNKEMLGTYVYNAMHADWSWKHSIRQYEEIYHKLLK